MALQVAGAQFIQLLDSAPVSQRSSKHVTLRCALTVPHNALAHRQHESECLVAAVPPTQSDSRRIVPQKGQA